MGGANKLTCSSITQDGNPSLTAGMVACVASTTNEVTCTLQGAGSILTSKPVVITLENGATGEASLKALGTVGTVFKFEYKTNRDTTALADQAGFTVMDKQMESAVVKLSPDTAYTGSTPTSIQFDLTLRQPLTAGHYIYATPTKTDLSTVGTLTVKSASQVTNTGLTAANFAAEVTATQMKIKLVTGTINNNEVVSIVLENGVAKFAPFGTAGEVVGFSFTTALATVGKSADGWTVKAAPATTTGNTQLANAVAAGANCVQAFASTGFYKGTWIQFGDGTTPPTEQKTIRALYTNTDCTGSEISTSRRLAPSSVVGVGLDSPLQYGYDADTAITAVEGGWGPTCFPGDAMVNVYNRGPTEIASISVGDKVLVESVGGERTFAPVLAFLHKVPGSIGLSHESVTVVHSQGTFRASANHLAFVLSEGGVRADMPVSALRPGDH